MPNGITSTDIQIPHKLIMHIGQSHLTTAMVDGEGFVLHINQEHHRAVQIVDFEGNVQSRVAQNRPRPAAVS